MPVAWCCKKPWEENTPQREETHTPGITDTHQEPPSLAWSEALRRGTVRNANCGWCFLTSSWFVANWTWSGNVVFCWGYRCSSLCIGCILPWLLMLYWSTLLCSEWWTNRQWFSPRKPTVFYCFHVSSVCLPAARLLPGATHAIYRVYFLLSTTWGGIIYTPEEEKHTTTWQIFLPREWKRTWIYLFFLWYNW